MATLKEIEELTGRFADARGALSSYVRMLERKIEDAKDAHLPRIKTALAKTKEAEARLRAAIEESEGLFERPKTQIFHGVKVGFQKLKGTISWEDGDKVVKFIVKFFTDQKDALTRTKVTPDKDALAKLSAADLKKLGVSVTNDSDAVVIKPMDGEVEKIVNALLKDRTGEAEAA